MAHADVSMAINHIRRIAASNVANGQRDLAKFAKELQERPVFAMEWGDSAFEAAAKVFVYQEVGDLVAPSVDFTDEQLIERLTKVIQNHIVCGARFPSRSTSACTNLMATHRLAKWADAGELVGL